MMRKIIPRSFDSAKIKIIDDFGIREVDRIGYLKKRNADGIIRIQEKDFKTLKRNRKNLTHFVLQYSDHIPGKVFLLVKIHKRGSFTGKDEELPILDFRSTFRAKIVSNAEAIPYDRLTKDDFRNSFPHIKNSEDLKKEIIYRYSHSMPKLSEKKILSLGVSKTDLEILGFEDNSKTYGHMRNGFGDGILEAAKKDKNIVALCADLKDSLKLDKFAKEFPLRFYEMGISEQNMMSAAAGMVINHKVPFVCSYAVFNPGRNWDQLRVSVCYSNHNVKILGGHAGLTTGADGATHQALEDIAITRVLPNLCVIVPCDEEQAKKATIAALIHKGPVYLRISREKSPDITEKDSDFKIGKAQVLRDGKDLSIIACGLMVQFALVAASKLEKEGVSAAVINMHTIKPLDKKTLNEYAKKTGAIVSVEEHQKAGGLGSAIAEVLSESPVPLSILGVEDIFGESGEGYELLERYGLSEKHIIRKSKEILKKKK